MILGAPAQNAGRAPRTQQELSAGDALDRAVDAVAGRVGEAGDAVEAAGKEGERAAGDEGAAGVVVADDAADDGHVADLPQTLEVLDDRGVGSILEQAPSEEATTKSPAETHRFSVS